MISHSHKFILICPPKTGSTSLMSILLNYCIIKKLREQKEFNSFDFFELDNDFDLKSWKKFTSKINTPRKHAALSSYHKFNLRNYNLFAVIRNPYDRAVSLWKWEESVKKQYNGVSFKQWLNMKMHWWHLPQCDFLQTDTIDMSSINLVRFENLEQDFNTLCNKIGIPRQQLPHKNATNHKHYTEYYDDETKQVVAEKYAKDIEYFGYEFGE